MNRRIIILLPILITASLISQEVISSSGNTVNSNGVNLSWSIGETVIETLEGGGVTLTQGFQQSNISISDISEEIESIYRVFPNPVMNQFTIQKGINSDETIEKVRLYNLNGKLVKEIQLANLSTVVNVSDLPAGSYLLQVTSKTKQKTFKIIKTN